MTGLKPSAPKEEGGSEDGTDGDDESTDDDEDVAME